MSRYLTIQGRQLAPSDIALVRRLLAENADWNRTRLSRELCRLWDWRTDKGLLKDMACRSMLRKLEQRKLIVLPPARNKGGQPRRIKEVPHSNDPIEASISQLKPIEVSMVPKRSFSDDLFHCLMDRYHYLGCHGHVGEHIKYMVHDRFKRPLACMLFGSAAWKTSARDQFIGWDPVIRKANLKLMTNNTRFLILPWVRVKNLASLILGACVKRLANDWQDRYGHELYLVETFVDRSRFAGTCYKAANWIYVGKTKGRTRQDRHHRIKTTIKDLYVYPLTADFQQRLQTGM